VTHLLVRHISSIRAQAEARNERELLILFSLLSGEESAIQKRSENWQEFMVASLLYVEPKTRNIELAYSPCFLLLLLLLHKKVHTGTWLKGLLKFVISGPTPPPSMRFWSKF